MICFAIFSLEIAKTWVKRKDIFIFDLKMYDKSEKRPVYPWSKKYYSVIISYKYLV